MDRDTDAMEFQVSRHCRLCLQAAGQPRGAGDALTLLLLGLGLDDSFNLLQRLQHDLQVGL